MTPQSPRIYTYKITFEETSYYYYGSHKEKKYDEYYMGSPVANKWCWELYTPKKQILEFFDFTNEGYIEAQEVEGRLIRPVFNTDKWCLNENCMGIYSLEQKSKAGKIGGSKTYKLGVGVHSLTSEEKSVVGKKSKELGLGIHALTIEQRKENSKKVGMKNRELGIGICGLTTEERRENVKITNSQRWECCITGYVSTASGVVQYQKGKKIDTSKSNRRRIS
jgi:IS1 family transposase